MNTETKLIPLHLNLQVVISTNDMQQFSTVELRERYEALRLIVANYEKQKTV